MNVLLTGGTGYIGSHTAVVLSKSGHRAVLYDNLSNSSDSVLEKLFQITGQSIPFIKGDVRDTELLISTLAAHRIDAVVHFAGVKAVGESVEKPVDYYANNVQGTISLLQAMRFAQTKTLVFSSSATVYGEPQYLPLDESHPTSATNPYAINLGTGKGYSVLDMIQAFEKASGQRVPYKIVARRAGDVAACYANPHQASEALNWRATRTLDDMCASTWRFQQSQRLSVMS